MGEVQLKMKDDGRGAFEIHEGAEVIAEMEIGVRHSTLIAYHTGVVERMKGQGLADKLFKEMVAFARKEGLKVVPRCAYVAAQFRRHPQEYADIWEKN
jgi:uncharacterized protein